jgi:hypothetical protein
LNFVTAPSVMLTISSSLNLTREEP